MLQLGASETELSSLLCHANHKPAEVLGQPMQCLYAVVTSREDHKHLRLKKTVNPKQPRNCETRTWHGARTTKNLLLKITAADDLVVFRVGRASRADTGQFAVKRGTGCGGCMQPALQTQPSKFAKGPLILSRRSIFTYRAFSVVTTILTRAWPLSFT